MLFITVCILGFILWALITHDLPCYLTEDEGVKSVLHWIFGVGGMIALVSLMGFLADLDSSASSSSSGVSKSDSDMPSAWREAGKKDREWEAEKRYREKMMEAAKEMEGY